MLALKKQIWANPIYRFAILFLGIYLVLYYFNLLFIGITAPGGIYSPFLDKHLNYIAGLRYVLLQTSASILEVLGYTTFTTDTWLRVSGRGGIILIYSCLGYGVMSFFTAFVIAWPKSLKSKIWFLPFGLLFIQTLNICRFILLSLYWKKSVFRGIIDHHDLFNLILYILLITVVYCWTREKNPGSKVLF